MSEEIRKDILTSAIVTRFAATFDREPPARDAPQGIHWCLCTPEAPTWQLGMDGHPVGGGGFLPKSDLPRRMWASSDLEFLYPLAVGAGIERRSRVLDAVEKTGSSGKLMFVTVAHEIISGEKVAIRETQAIVYREAAQPPPQSAEEPMAAFPAPDPARSEGWSWQRSIAPPPLLLFRYSALTFNSHRIHYDLPYAREAEAYSALVVQGPLMATLLLDLCDRELGANRLARFSFRAKSPAFANEPLLLVGRTSGDDLELAVLGADGRSVMAATALVA